ncbi:ATPase family AAA domain-containing protein 1-A [Glycine max]|nr:ATPase family AAA domain-containing protein 1-A [Glycine max]
MGGSSETKLMQDLLLYAASAALSCLVLFAGLRHLDPNRESSKKALEHKKEIAKRLGRPLIQTNPYEDVIACDIINPDHIDVEFNSIGGLETIKQALFELVILPLKRPDLFSHGKLLGPQKGVLLYGPPGTGKTMLAKAIAKESGAVFINVRISNLMSKWFGDAQKLENAQVMVLAATNRPSELDEAILRRLPQAFEIGVPDQRERTEILKVVLKGERVEDNIDFGHIAGLCEGYTGSDLFDLCKKAAYFPIRELLDEEKKGKRSPAPRPLSQLDLEKALATSQKTNVAASEYSGFSLQSPSRWTVPGESVDASFLIFHLWQILSLITTWLGPQICTFPLSKHNFYSEGRTTTWGAYLPQLVRGDACLVVPSLPRLLLSEERSTSVLQQALSGWEDFSRLQVATMQLPEQSDCLWLCQEEIL